MKWIVFGLLVFAVSFASAQCSDAACQAYVWGYPLWHAVNQRYLQNQNSPLFQLNNFTARVSTAPVPNQLPQLTLCNATLCAGLPWALNPSPVVAPNVDTIYGSVTWDLGLIGQSNPGGAYKFVLPYPDPSQGTAIRYASVIFYDQFTNVLSEYSLAQQTPPYPSILCLVQIQGHPACQGLATKVAPLPVITVVLPRYGFAIVRGYSIGAASPPPLACGVDGCGYLLGVASQFSVLVPPQSTKSYLITYGAYMSNSQSGTCPYVYGQPTCGLNGNKSAFWDALCVALADNPVTGSEASYVENNFGSLGIHATGCVNLDYATLNAGITTGYAYVASKLATTGVASGPWVFLPFTGNWGVSSQASALLRAVTSTRLEYMNGNGAAVYWTAFTDSNGLPLNAAWGTTYKLVWRDSAAFVDGVRGFWSVTLYDSTEYLYSPPVDQKQYAIRGSVNPPTGEIHISNTCATSANCIRANPGSFNIIFRAYAPLPNIQPNGGYTLPDIIKCDCHTPCY